MFARVWVVTFCSLRFWIACCNHETTPKASAQSSMHNLSSVPSSSIDAERPSSAPINTAKPYGVELLAIKQLQQDSPVWCWAASAEILMDFANPGQAAPQCEHARCMFQQNGAAFCCDKEKRTQPCVERAFPRFDLFKYTADSSRRWPKWPVIAAELKKRPIAITQDYSDHSHMAVMRGVVPELTWVLLWDPQSRLNDWIDYEAYRRKKGDFRPGKMFLNVTRTNASSDTCTPLVNVKPEEPRDDEESAGADDPISEVALTSASPEAARHAGLELIKAVAQTEPERLGFASAKEASQAYLACNEQIEVFQKSDQPPPVSYCINGEERGVLLVAEVASRVWAPVRFHQAVATRKIQERRDKLKKEKRKIVSLVYIPALGRFLFRLEQPVASVTSGTLVPVEAFDGLEQAQSYTEKEILDVLKNRNGRFLQYKEP